MKFYTEISMENFRAWSGAVDTLETIKRENKCDELEALLEEVEPADGWSECGINDLLWFESDWLYEMLGIDTDEDEDNADDLPPAPPEVSIL